MEVLPTQPEARRLVASIVIFWLITGVAVLSDPEATNSGAIGFVLIVVALTAGWVFYRTLFTVGGRSTGRSPGSYLGWRVPRWRGPDSTWSIGQEGWAILLKVVNPRWWGQVVRATHWPVTATTAVLLGSFGVTLLAMAVTLG